MQHNDYIPRRGKRAVTKRTGYLSYLLRLWQTSDKEQFIWRASLEQPGTQERQGFATLDELFQFLRDQTTAQREQPGAKDEQWQARSGS
jgi:hypothetical protein